MDTKSKKSKPFGAWLSFFMAVNLIGVLLLTGFGFFLRSGSLDSLKAPFVGYENSTFFKQRTAAYFNNLLSIVESNSGYDPSYRASTIAWLDQEGLNLRYCAVNLGTGLVIKNFSEPLSFSKTDNLPVLPAEYKYYWYFDGHKLQVIKDGQPVDVDRLDSGYRNIVPNLYSSNGTMVNKSNIKVVLAVRSPLIENPYAQSLYFKDRQLLMLVFGFYIGLAVLALLLLVYSIIKRKEKRQFDRLLASWSGKLWVEIKLFISFLLLVLSVNISWSGSDLESMLVMSVFLSCCVLVVCWWIYLMVIDLIYNGKNFVSNNIINSLLTWYRRLETLYPWQKSMIRRAYLLVAAEVVLAPISVLFLMGGNGDGLPTLISLIIAALGLYLIFRYLKRFSQTIKDLGKLTDQIEVIKNGDMATRLELDADADLSRAAKNLNSIQEGMSIAVAEKTRSERMKMELITNVSHDLKTPLTSIISYVDLLAKEENLPGHVSDYIQVLAQKSERLKNIVEDLFDLSKASSASIAMDFEKIDLARLIKQTMADMEEPINASGLTFRTSVPDEPVFIMSDGKKLYRVWENLITNALKYSLAGSRVFVDLSVENGQALATIKNTSNYEMKFTEDEILQRFVRGDESRTSEGSGLGLSIAQSFTQISGGKFSITMDGDLFKASLRFDILSPEPVF